MKVLRCATPAEFLERAGPFLLADETCHNLLLGVPATVPPRGDSAMPEPYFAVVLESGAVAAAAMLTPPHPLVLSRTDRPEALRLIALDLQTAGIVPPGVHGPVPASGRFADIWRQVTGRRHEPSMRQRIYRLERVRAAASVSGRLRQATPADRAVLIPWIRAFHVEAFGDHPPPVDPEQLVDRRLRAPTAGFCIWDDDGPRSLAGYSGPTPNGIRVGPVYTPPEQRNRGYASACVATVSQLLLDRGHRFCFLYTDLANPTSNRIYQRIGYEAACDAAEHRFLPA